MAKNILICDDAAFMRMMIKDILTKNGYNIVGEAENGASESIQSGAKDFIVKPFQADRVLEAVQKVVG